MGERPSLESLGFSTRVWGIFRNWGHDPILSLEDLVARSERDLLSRRNCGRASINEIRQKLASVGLALADEAGWTRPMPERRDVLDEIRDALLRIEKFLTPPSP